LGFCSKCGQKASEDDYFCSRCGAKTKKGTEAGATTSSEEWRDSFAKVGEEMEKAFSTAAKEIREAFKKARENIHEATSEKTVVCKSCGQENQGDSSFCYKCGKKLDRK